MVTHLDNCNLSQMPEKDGMYHYVVTVGRWHNVFPTLQKHHKMGHLTEEGLWDDLHVYVPNYTSIFNTSLAKNAY